MRNTVFNRGVQRPIMSDVESFDNSDIVEYLYTLLDDCFKYGFDNETFDTLMDYKITLGGMIKEARSGSVSISSEAEDALIYVQGLLNLLLSEIRQSATECGEAIKAYLNDIF